ncbi:MAG: bifunctional enoyl-CoA hydratase/phosphate acetyltransferase [Acidobacteriota bacterium]|nr:bifunctional enoyl-CoA hydratase/phosphate acetyltransferase [Acidobacteriota bacterium]
MITSLDGILDAIREHPRQTVAVAVAAQASVVEAIKTARDRDIAGAVLVGDRAEIERLCEQAGLSGDGVEIVDEPDDLKAARTACLTVREGRADILMKGHIHTDDFLRALLSRETGLRTDTIMSHVFILETTRRGKLTLVTDAAMNIAPDLEGKAEIILNAVYLANCLGIDDPKVGVLAATEQVNPKMQATLDAAALHAMEHRNQFPTCRVDGPLALDNAVSVDAAREKKIPGDVAGDCDILVCPNIEAGNILAKSFVFLGGGRLAGVLVGASAPVVLTSRADSAEAKMYSIAAAVLMAGLQRTGRLKIGRVHF